MNLKLGKSLEFMKTINAKYGRPNPISCFRCDTVGMFRWIKVANARAFALRPTLKHLSVPSAHWMVQCRVVVVVSLIIYDSGDIESVNEMAQFAYQMIRSIWHSCTMSHDNFQDHVNEIRIL